MKKLLLIFLTTFSLSCFSQKKDSVKPAVDNVFVLSTSDMNMITGIIRSNPVQVQGKTLTFDELLQLVNYLYGKAQFVQKKINLNKIIWQRKNKHY